MTRGHIRRLTAERNVAPARAAAPPAVRAATPTPSPAPAAIVAPASARPVVPEAIDERFVAVRRPQAGLLYRPALLGTARLHYVKSTLGVDDWRTLTLLAPLDEETVDAPWERAEVKGEPGLDLEDKPEVDVGFEPLPAPASQPRRYTRWKRDLVNHLYRTETLDFWRSRKPKLVSRPGETEGDFRSRLTLQAREARDLDVEKLRKRFGPKLVRIRDRIRRSQERVEREQAQYKEQKISTVLSFGSTLLGALFGRKVASRGNISSMATSVRRAGRAARERGDIGRAREELKSQEQKLRDLEAEFEEEVAALEERLDPRDLEADHLPLSPRKSDIDVSRLCLVWMPWRVLTDGAIEPAFADPARRSSLA